MVHARGPAAERVRTWTVGQTLARDRYRVVVAAPATAPGPARAEVEALLGPDDELMPVAGDADTELWNAGAARAGTPWLVFTEGHCLAEPGCLEAVARWIETVPPVGAGNFRVGHRGDHLLSRLAARWFDQTHARWRAPGEWPRLHRSGFAIRAAEFEAAGGFGPYGQFAPTLLSARLHARAVGIGAVPGAAVVHLDDPRMRDHHRDTADHARGELEARAESDAVFFERYFGHDPLWSNRLRHGRAAAGLMARAVAAAAWRRPGRWPTLAAPLGALVLAALLGIGPRVMLDRVAIAWAELAVDRIPLPGAWRWRRFLRAHARVVRRERLDWIRRRGPVPPPGGTGCWPVEALGPGAIVGVHGLEEWRGRRFRWTEPVVLLRLLPPGPHELRLETGGLRGAPDTVVVAAVAGGRVLPRALLASDAEGTLIVRCPGRWSAAARDGLVLVCGPLVPARAGSSDTRRLGLPVFSVTVAPALAAGGS
jgi:hypothetical protein